MPKTKPAAPPPPRRLTTNVRFPEAQGAPAADYARGSQLPASAPAAHIKYLEDRNLLTEE